PEGQDDGERLLGTFGHKSTSQRPEAGEKAIRRRGSPTIALSKYHSGERYTFDFFIDLKPPFKR
ncbi:MAG: hypothetical protein OQK68_04850, partial [Sedimenticola sp.]|nr:hypothetical protein [Sedimenticola sp.]